MLIFGAKAIPECLRNSQDYRPYCVTVGKDRYWGPTMVDIKPIFFIYNEDRADSVFLISDWVEQCLSRMVITLKDALDIDHPDDLSQLMEELEWHIYKVIAYPNKTIQL